MSLAGRRGEVRGLKADGMFGVFGVFGCVEARVGRDGLTLWPKIGEVMLRGECIAIENDVSILPRVTFVKGLE